MAAMVELTPLRHAAAKAGGIANLLRELGKTRQNYYAWVREGGSGALDAILIERLTGVDRYSVCRERDHGKLDLVNDFYARRA